MTEAGTPSPDFPALWPNAADAEKFWLFYGSYMPEPLTPIEEDIIAGAHVTGWNRAFTYLQAGRFRVQFFNGYYYATIDNLPMLSAQDIESLKTEKIAPLTAQLMTQGLPADASFELWAEKWLAEVKTHLAALDQMGLPGQSLPTLVDYLEQTLERTTRIFEIHTLQFPIMLMVIAEFEQFYQDLFGKEGIPHHQLLHKYVTHAIQGNRRLWQLSRQLQEQPALKTLFLTCAPSEIMAQLATTSAGAAIQAEINDYLDHYGKQNELMSYARYPAWCEDPTPVFLNFKTHLTQSERDFEAELRQKQQQHENALATVRAAVAAYPQPVIDEFEALLAKAQKATYVLDEHTYWMDLAPNYYLRQVLLALGRALQSAGALDHADDIFYLRLAELRPLVAKPTDQRATVAQRRADLARFQQMTPPPTLGAFPAGPPPVNPVMDVFYATSGMPLPPAEDPTILLGYGASPGIVEGPVKILRSVREVDKLAPGDILVTSLTTPVWTPIFAHAAGIITDSGGMLSHPAIVAREMGIPAVVGTGRASHILQDGQRVTLNGSTGKIQILELANAAEQ